MKEPQRLDMETGEPVKAQIKKYPLNSLEKETNAEEAFAHFIQKAKESKKKYDLWVKNQKNNE